MKNADRPAMPQAATQDGYACDYYDYGGPGIPTGMTKREMVAMAAMQGLCAHSGDYHQPEHLAMDAVMFADALLAELERTK